MQRRGASSARRSIQNVERDAVSLEGKAPRDVLSQNENVDAQQRIPLKFRQEHVPCRRMLAGKGAETTGMSGIHSIGKSEIQAAVNGLSVGTMILAKECVYAGAA